MLYYPADPSINSQDFRPLGAPIKKTEEKKDKEPVYEKTGTPGVVVNKSTGMMETQIPGNDKCVYNDPEDEYWGCGYEYSMNEWFNRPSKSLWV